MNIRPGSILSVLSLLVTLLVPNLTFAEEAGAEEAGKVRVGVLYENLGSRNLGRQISWYGNFGGVVLGYEKNYSDFWWALDGKYRYGRLSYMDYDIDTANIKGQAVVGKSYDMGGVTLKPYAGLGFDWVVQDMRGSSDASITEYLLVFGTRAERKFDAGMVGLDLQFDYVLGREVYYTDNENYWARRVFDGSYSIEAGAYYEPANLPIGVRPYFKYEKWQKTKLWKYNERHHIGIETYVKF